METIEIIDVILEPNEIDRIEHYFDEYPYSVKSEVESEVTLLPFIVYAHENNGIFLFDKTCLLNKPIGLTIAEWKYLSSELEELLEK